MLSTAHNCSNSTPATFPPAFIKRWYVISLGFFLLAALLGAFMRYFYLHPVAGFNYQYLLHAHSHTAMLGWGYTALAGTLLFVMVKNTVHLQFYKWLFWLNVISGLGMAVSFTLQGYGAISITFSTLHIICAYGFAWCFLADIITVDQLSYKWARWAVYWMLVSTLGVWVLGPVVAVLGKSHPLYFSAIQFFLHFQFNGWFIYGVVALLLFLYENSRNPVNISPWLLTTLNVALVLTYSYIIIYAVNHDALYVVNGLAGLMQLVVYLALVKLLFQIIKTRSIFVMWLLRLVMVSLVFKGIMQALLLWPQAADVAYAIRNLIIGFIHLNMLGILSFALVAIAMVFGMVADNRCSRLGWVLVVTGFLSTELVLFGQALLLWSGFGSMPAYHEVIFICTLFLPVGLFIALLGWLGKTKQFAC